MSIRKINNKWRLDERPFGIEGPRLRATFETKKEAAQYLSDFIVSYNPNNTKRLSDLVDIWYEYHGNQLKDHKYRYSRMLAIAARLGNPYSTMFSASCFAKYRKVRLRSVSVETINHETRYFRAMFNELINLGFWYDDNPMRGIRVFPVPERELAFLDDEQIKRLLYFCKCSKSEHLLSVVKLALSTGARWNEANGLLRAGLLSDRVRFTNTKNGKSRVVPLDVEFAGWLRSVSLAKGERCFLDCRSSFRRAVKASGIELPTGQLTHVLRHTYASHFVMNGGDIVTLQKILGHSDLKVTMRYAHLSPDYLSSARAFAPNVNL